MKTYTVRHHEGNVCHVVAEDYSIDDKGLLVFGANGDVKATFAPGWYSVIADEGEVPASAGPE